MSTNLIKVKAILGYSRKHFRYYYTPSVCGNMGESDPHNSNAHLTPCSCACGSESFKGELIIQRDPRFPVVTMAAARAPLSPVDGHVNYSGG